MINVKVDVKGLKELENTIKKIDSLIQLQKNVNMQTWFQEKCLETVNEVAKRRVTFTGETVDRYLANNKLEKLENGFVIYNDTYVESNSKEFGGKFSIALAFEYGTGLVGAERAKDGAWRYNINNYDDGWLYFKNNKVHFTRGYEGFEVYRFAKIEIEKNMNKWIEDYLKNNKEV